MSGVIAVCAAVLVGAGCGGGDRLSKAEFQQRANAICAKYQKRIDALGQPQSIDEVSK